MMDIFMLAAGAGLGVMLRDLFVLYRGDKNIERQQLEAKTPYDHALTNAISEQGRLVDELETLRTLKRTQTDTERIRNEIETILSEDAEGASECVYEPYWYGGEGREYLPIQAHPDGTISPIGCTVETRDGLLMDSAPWDARIPMEEMADNLSKAFASVYTNDDKSEDVCEVIEHTVAAGETLSTIARKYSVKIWDIVEENDLLIYDDLDEIGVISVGQKLKIRCNVRKDGTEDERLAEGGVECSLTKAVKYSIENEKGIRVCWTAPSGRNRAVYGIVSEVAYVDERVNYFQIAGIYIDALDVEKITEGRDINGETLHRKGSR